MGKTILVAFIVIVVGAVAAFAGYRVGDGAGFERANQVRQQFFQQRQAGQNGAGGAGGPASGAGGSGGIAGGGSGAGRAFTVQGTIKSVDGDTLTITLGNRDVKVNLSDKTQLLKSVTGTRAELAAGAHVMITPEGSSTGGGDSLNAASVTILPSQ
jgi:hypothetical protein